MSTRDVHPGLAEPFQENVVLYNVESILVNEAWESTSIFSIKRQQRGPEDATDAKMAFMPTEFFIDEQGNRWVKFWPKNGPAKGKQMSIPIERLIGVVHSS
jgi:hypothetical protein